MCLRLMPHPSLLVGFISVTMGLRRVYNLPQAFLLFFGQINIPGSPVVLQPVSLGRAWNSNHALRSNPSQSDLRQGTALFLSKLLYLVYNISVLVEILALEFGNCE